jgi:hypothetical protein
MHLELELEKKKIEEMEYHPISQRHCLDKGVKTCDKPPVVRAETGYFCAVGRAAVGAQLLSPPSVRIYIYTD